MRYLVLVVAAAGFTSAVSASPHDALPAAVAAFLDEEVAGATAERKDAIAACILTAFDGTSDDLVATVLALDDFEDGLDLLVEAHPEREQILEACEEL